MSPARRAAWAMIGCAVAGGCALLLPAFRLLGAHADVTYPESAIVYNAQLAARTSHVYTPISQPPYTPAVYGPAYYLGLAAGARRSIDVDTLLVRGRLFSLSCFLAVVLAAWFLTRRLGATPLFATLAGALVFGDPEFFRTNVSARPDLPALAFAMWGVVAALIDPDDWRPVAAAGMLTSLAALMKPSFVAAPVALVIWLLISRRSNALRGLAAGAGVAVLSLCGWLLAHGDPILGQAPLLAAGMSDPAGAVALIARETFHYWPHVVVIAGAIAFMRRAIQPWTSSRALVALYCIASWVVAAVTLTNPGGNVNYLLEPWTVSSALFAMALSEFPAFHRPRRWAVIAVCAAAAAGGLVHAVRVARDRSVTDYSSLAAVAARRDVVSDVPYISVHDRRPELLDPFLIAQLQAAGRWNDGPIRGELRRQQFDFVALTTYNERLRRYRKRPFVSPALLSEILANYSPYCETQGQGPKQFERLLVLLPKRSLDANLAGELEQSGCTPSVDPALLDDVSGAASTATR